MVISELNNSEKRKEVYMKLLQEKVEKNLTGWLKEIIKMLSFPMDFTLTTKL